MSSAGGGCYRMPNLWLFPGQEPGSHVTTGALQDACRRARKAPGSRSPSRLTRCVTVSPPISLKAGSIFASSRLSGPRPFDVDTRYTQVATNLIASTPSPFDRLSLQDLRPSDGRACARLLRWRTFFVATEPISRRARRKAVRRPAPRHGRHRSVSHRFARRACRTVRRLRLHPRLL